MALGVKKIFQHHDYLGLHEIRNFIIHLVAGDPGSPVTGGAWYDTVANRFKVRVSGATKTLAHTDEITGVTFDNPVASAVGDTMAQGSDGDGARADHRHAREAFAAPTAQTSFGASSATGTATTVPHSDHAHGTPTHDAAAHSAISLSAFAVPTGNISMGSNKLTSVTDGTADSDAATVGQMNALLAGLSWKDPVRAASTANGTLASAFENGDTLDGITLATGDRVLLKDQTAGAENGIYTVNATGAPTRATDADSTNDLQGAAVIVSSGTANADTAWYTGTDSINVGTTAIVWSPFPGFAALIAGAGLTKTANTVDVGAALGVTVGTNDVGIDKTLVPIFKTGLVGGAGPATSYTITNPGFVADRRIMVEVIEEATGETVSVGIGRSAGGNITVDFGAASVAGTDYRYMATGLAA